MKWNKTPLLLFIALAFCAFPAFSAEPETPTATATTDAADAPDAANAQEASEPAPVPADDSQNEASGTAAIPNDYDPDVVPSTRMVSTKSKNCSTFYLMYTRTEDVIKTLTPLYETEIGAGDLKIAENPVTNAIIIKAKEPESPLAKEVEEVIRSLDFRTGQVLIDVLVVDVTISDDESFGLEMKGLVKNPLDMKQSTLTLGADHGTIDKNDPSAAVDGFKAFLTSQNKLKVFLNATRKKGNVKVLSSPHIIAANHREATFKIGEKLPLIQSVRPSDMGPIKTFDIKDIGLELKVTPHINRGGQIDIAVHQTINGVGSYDPKEGTARMTMREAETNLTVSNGETIVLGGFIEEKSDVTEKRIPFLSNLPVIGKAFTNKVKNRGKSELMVFLTPKIIDSLEDAQNQTELKRRSLSERNEVARLLKRMQRQRPAAPASEAVIVDRRSTDWQYDFDRPEIDEIAWEYPSSIEPASFTLTRTGSCPFGFGPSHRITPPMVRTYLKPSEGALLRKDFRVDDPTAFRTLTLKVASNDAAVVYLNGRMIDEDPLMKVKDGHDFDYWNSVRTDIPVTLLKPGINTLMVILGSDKTTSDGYFDLMLIGRR
ncbi:MAG TPA: hypothetical protein VIV61_03135 [Candidatus Ozemobacteraceae bacterium]